MKVELSLLDGPTIRSFFLRAVEPKTASSASVEHRTRRFKSHHPPDPKWPEGGYRPGRPGSWRSSDKGDKYNGAVISRPFLGQSLSSNLPLLPSVGTPSIFLGERWLKRPKARGRHNDLVRYGRTTSIVGFEYEVRRSPLFSWKAIGVKRLGEFALSLHAGQRPFWIEFFRPPIQAAAKPSKAGAGWGKPGKPFKLHWASSTFICRQVPRGVGQGSSLKRKTRPPENPANAVAKLQASSELRAATARQNHPRSRSQGNSEYLVVQGYFYFFNYHARCRPTLSGRWPLSASSYTGTLATIPALRAPTRQKTARPWESISRGWRTTAPQTRVPFILARSALSPSGNPRWGSLMPLKMGHLTPLLRGPLSNERPDRDQCPSINSVQCNVNCLARCSGGPN